MGWIRFRLRERCLLTVRATSGITMGHGMSESSLWMLSGALPSEGESPHGLVRIAPSPASATVDRTLTGVVGGLRTARPPVGRLEGQVERTGGNANRNARVPRPCRWRRP